MAKENREKGLERSFKIDRSKVNESERTIELAFSSESPVERWGENEVLSHEKGDYDFDRIKDGTHPLLLGHAEYDPDSQIGVIASARVDSDKVGRAVVRFGNSAKASEIFKDVLDGIRQNISVGYDRTGIVESKKATDGMVTTRYRWMPTHIAIVPVPADTKVGIGRSVKRRCADCEGTGRCRCRDNDDDDADDDCDICGGDGDCPDCRGLGYITTAKSKQVDSQNKSKQKKNFMPEPKTEIIEADVRKDERTKAVADTEKAERARTKEITFAADEFIKTHGRKNDGKAADEIRKFANEAIEKGEAPNDFNTRAMRFILTATEPEKVLASDFLSREEMSQFSLMRCIQQAAKSRMKGGPGVPDEKEFEGEVVKEYRERCEKTSDGLGYSPSGFVVPPDTQFGSHTMSRAEAKSAYRKLANRYGRDMQVGVFGQGGAVVPTYWLLPVIELLRNKIVLTKLGVRTMAGLTGNVIIPRLEGPSTAYSVGEIAALTASNQTLGQISMTPHRVGNTVNYSKQLVFQSSPDIEGLIRDDMMEVIALKHDVLGLNGQGAGDEPLGLFNTPGIGAVTFGATPTFIKMVSFQTLIRNQNVMGRLAYTSTSATKGSLKTVAEALTGATTIGGAQNAIWKDHNGDGEEDGEVNGCQAIDSQQIPNNQVLAGVFNHFIHAIWGGFDVVVDYYTKAINAEIAVTMNTWLDFAARHPQAFCASTDAGNQ